MLLAVQSTAQQQDVFERFAGTYITGHEFGGSSLRLEADGHFSTGSGSDDGTEISTSGTYTLSDGALHFLVVKKTGKRGGEGRELNLFDRQDRIELFGISEDEEPEREFKMLPIEWSGRIYLICEKDLEDFANAVNLGLEPRPQLSSNRLSSPWYGSFYLRSGDEQKKVTGNPPLPEPWLSFLLSKPITATVISIEETRKSRFSTTFTATINKGSRDGLKVGMRLLTTDEEPSPWGGTKMISVKEKTAKIETDLVRSELKVGDKISSKYETKYLYR
jgi:hypothetical protein